MSDNFISTPLKSHFGATAQLRPTYSEIFRNMKLFCIPVGRVIEERGRPIIFSLRCDLCLLQLYGPIRNASFAATSVNVGLLIVPLVD